MIIIIMKKSQETMVFNGTSIDFRCETEARKVMVDFKFDALYSYLHREPPEVGLVEKLTGSLYWWVELCMPTLHRKCYRTL